MTDLVERLRADTRSAAHCAMSEEAATALEAQAKELAALRAERDDALSRVEELEQSADVVSDEFEKDCWKAMRRLLSDCKLDWQNVDPGEGVSADSAYEYLKECIDELELDGQRARARAETAERRVTELEARQAADLAEFGLMEVRAETAERERDMLGEVIEDTARELGCKNDNEEILFAIDKLRRERDEAREALKPFAKVAATHPIALLKMGIFKADREAARAITGGKT